MEYPENQQGKCETCGFLSKHGRGVWAPMPRFYEIEAADRTTANRLFEYDAPGGHFVNCDVVCFEGRVDFMAEIAQLPNQGEMDRRLLAMIQEDRHCEAWYPYTPGFTATEHYQEMHMRLFEKALEEERASREKSYRRQDRYFVIASLILAAGQIIAAIILSYHDSYADKLLRSIFGPR